MSRCATAFLALVILPGTALADIPPGYYAGASGLTGTAYRTALHNIIRDTHVIMSYSASRGALETVDQDPANPANVILIYSRRSEPKTNFVGSSASNEFQWNREHLWPNSLGIDDNETQGYSDIHHLRPADVEVNSDRGNLPFDETNSADGTVQAPAHVQAALTSQDPNSWEPPPEVKGDIARSMFYMDLRYDGENGGQDLQLTDNMGLISNTSSYMGRLTTLLLWHLSDPVSDAEIARHERAWTRQGNRNPFIDMPALAQQLWGDPTTLTASRTGGQLTLTWWAGLQNPVLQTSTTLQNIWTTQSGTASTTGLYRALTVNMPGTEARRFWRISYRGITAP